MTAIDFGHKSPCIPMPAQNKRGFRTAWDGIDAERALHPRGFSAFCKW